MGSVSQGHGNHSESTLLAPQYSPHVDEILRQCHGVWISGNGDRTIGGTALSLLAVADPDHRARNLTDLGDLGTTLADDAADQLVRHCHLVRLIVRRWLLPIRVAGAQLAAC